MSYTSKEIGISDVRSIIAYVKERHNFDFSYYALASFRLRVGHYLTTNNDVTSVESLIIRLKDLDFFKTFLAKITPIQDEMFRDIGFWLILKNEILARKPENASLKIWFPSVGDGSDLFSLVILIHKLNLENQVEIIASDMNEYILRKVKNFSYSLSSMGGINKDNYERLFEKNDLNSYYTVVNGIALFNKVLFQKINFLTLSLVAESFVLKNDIIICRNSLIYYTQPTIFEITNKFYDSLNNRGVLCLGHHERIDSKNLQQKFDLHQSQESIYLKR